MTWTLDTSTLADGKHTLKLEINDLDGNQAYDHWYHFGLVSKVNLLGKTH